MNVSAHSRRTSVCAAVLAIGASVALAAAAAAVTGLRINLTGSIPPGIYRTVQFTISRGAIVLVCLPPRIAGPARERGYIPDGSCPDGSAPVGKPIVAVAGDTVDVSELGVAVNRALLANSRPLTRDSRGMQLNVLRIANRRVADHELWLVSSHSPRSFDSRYFGAVPISAVRARLIPVLTEK